MRTVALNGFTGTVALAASGLPPGATATTESGTGDALVIVSTTTSAAVGTSHFVITGTSGSLTHTASASLAIAALAPPSSGDFSLALGSTTESAAQGSAAIFEVGVSRSGGFAGAVAIEATGLPAGVTAARASTSAESAILALTTSATAPIGSYPFTIIGTSEGLQRTTAATLNVIPRSVGRLPAPAGTGGCSSSSYPSYWALGVMALLMARQIPRRARQRALRSRSRV